MADTDATKSQYIAWGAQALVTELQAIEAASAKIGEHFADAVDALLQLTGKVVVTGLGKSGHVGRKVASTLASTGTSAFFLHPAEALHGDFGVLQSNDAIIAIAFGGETSEVIEVARYARRIGIPVIGLTGRRNSTLAQLAHYVLDGSVASEADPHNLAPTASSTLAMALGDALAVSLMRARGFAEQDFAALHPGGSLGRKLSLVKDHMQGSIDQVGVALTTNFHDTLQAVTAQNFGIVAVLGSSGELIGAISDGDIRRVLLSRDSEALQLSAAEIMTADPKTIGSQELAIDALRIMNERRITQLFVVDGRKSEASNLSRQTSKLIGIVRLHDLLAANII